MSMIVFWRQFRSLVWKNWIVLAKHPFINLLRCFILPIALGIFLAHVPNLMSRPGNRGIGDPAPIRDFSQVYDGSLLFPWVDETNVTSKPTPDEIMSRITAGFSQKQMASIRKVGNRDEIEPLCPANFNGFSDCFGAVAFTSLPVSPSSNSTIQYTIFGDAGWGSIDVVGHTGDFENRVMPLQFAINRAILQAHTGKAMAVPLEWSYTTNTNQEAADDVRRMFLALVSFLLALGLFICYIGISYQLAGSMSSERAALLTSHMKVMGLKDSARVFSWHVSLSLAYFPAWIIISVIWGIKMFPQTNMGLIIVTHVLTGLSLASYSMFISAPFGRSPQLSAVASTLIAIAFAVIVLMLPDFTGPILFVITIVLPPGFYIAAITVICNRELALLDPYSQGIVDPGMALLPALIGAVINIFLWPYLGLLWEKKLFEAPNPGPKKRRWWGRSGGELPTAGHTLPPGVAISIQHLNKTFRGPKKSIFHPRGAPVVAVQDLTIDIPKYGIFVLLGPNGSGKSTTLSVLSGLSGKNGGTVLYAPTHSEDVTAPALSLARGDLGVVPQKNVLFPDLTCLQTLRLWEAIKRSGNARPDEDLEQLLRDCDLGLQTHKNAGILSGGQKRKLQLAIGIVGGSKVLLVDECTSGVDPLSRRAIWRTLTSLRHDRTIIFTTHFLDEADLLADHIAILGAPGKLLAQGSPVTMKRELGAGYTVQVTFSPDHENIGTSPALAVLSGIKGIVPAATLTETSPLQVSYHLKTKDAAEVHQVLQLLQNRRTNFSIASYDLLGTTIEDIFLDLVSREDIQVEPTALDDTASLDSEPEDEVQPTAPLNLASSRRVSPLGQALTIFHKRALIARRSWLVPLLSVIVTVVASTVPSNLIVGDAFTCVQDFDPTATQQIFPYSFSSRSYNSPPGIISTLGNVTMYLQAKDFPDNTSFVEAIRRDYRNLTYTGGISVDVESGSALLAYDTSYGGFNGLQQLGLASNIIWAHFTKTNVPPIFENATIRKNGPLQAPPPVLQAGFRAFPSVITAPLQSLRWLAFFGLAMAVYPGFYAMYVSKERRSSIQAMQFSNGLSNPLGLWLGHLMFDFIFSVVAATIIAIVFAVTVSQFHGMGFLWLVLILYGLAGTLFAYCISLAVSSPVAAFSAVAGYQSVIFLCYLAGYLLTQTYARTSQAGYIMTVVHFTLSLLSPLTSVIRAVFVSLNMFSLLCGGGRPTSPAAMISIKQFGGPILYLIVWSFVLMAILVWVDSGSILRRGRSKEPSDDQPLPAVPDVEENKTLKVWHISKAFSGKQVVEDVSIEVQDTVYALLGPNGAGKSTTLNVIRGDTKPESGDVFINGTSVIRHPRTARFSLGVCPQFTAIDAQLTVREHLMIYGRLKGVEKGKELDESIDVLLEGTRLSPYKDRLAKTLSGGNQRKLALAIALLGNPPVILIDEFSTGIDAKMKREMWKTLRKLAYGKAIVITTHSMEEASVLANEVGILAKRMLAVGTVRSLSDKNLVYNVHFSCRTREEVVRAQAVMAKIPNARRADDVATRFEVPIQTTASGEEGLSLADLFQLLQSHGDFAEYTVDKGSLETVFLKVVKESNVQLDDSEKKRKWYKLV